MDQAHIVLQVFIAIVLALFLLSLYHDVITHTQTTSKELYALVSAALGILWGIVRKMPPKRGSKYSFIERVRIWATRERIARVKGHMHRKRVTVFRLQNDIRELDRELEHQRKRLAELLSKNSNGHSQTSSTSG